MSLEQIHYSTFKQGSTTYFNSSLFFPPALRRDVFVLYGFVRVADNYVDNVPQYSEGFYKFKQSYQRAWKGSPVGDPIIDTFVDLARAKGFDPAWTEAFLHSMQYINFIRDIEEDRILGRRYLIPIKTASDMYKWTARIIEANPLVDFQYKVKPTKARILRTVLGNILGAA